MITALRSAPRRASLSARASTVARRLLGSPSGMGIIWGVNPPALRDFTTFDPQRLRTGGTVTTKTRLAAGRVLVLAKKELAFSSPSAKDADLSDEEEVVLHLQDTLSAGDGLCNPAAVKILLDEGPERIDELIAWGKHHATKLVFEPESSHSRYRSLHAEGESTGQEILRVLHLK